MFGSTEAAAFHVYVSAFFFFFFFVKLKCYCSSLLWTVVVTFDREQCIYALFMDPQITLFNNFFIKNGSHGTIYTFKNYFATVFSVFSFQFQQNKFYPNRPLLNFFCRIKKDWYVPVASCHPHLLFLGTDLILCLYNEPHSLLKEST